MRTHRSGECVKQGRVRERENEERCRTLFGVMFVEEERNRATEVEAEAERWVGFEEGDKWRVRKRPERVGFERRGERYFVSRLWRKSETERLRWRRRQRGG